MPKRVELIAKNEKFNRFHDKFPFKFPAQNTI